MLKCRKTLLLVALMLGFGALACTIGLPMGQPSKPVVEIVSPLNGSEVELGKEVLVLFRAVDEAGVSRVELEANGQIVAVKRSDRAEGEPSMRATLPWTPAVPGSQTLLVYAYNTDGVMSDAVGVSLSVVTSAPTSTIAQPTPGETTVSVPTETLSAPTAQPPAPTETVAPPTVAPPTATVTQLPPPSPTPTLQPAPCPVLRVTLGPSQTRPRQAFGIQFERIGAIPAGYDYVVEFSGDKISWYRTQPVPAKVRQDGIYWMAETTGPGVDGTFYWKICLVNMANPEGPAVCCTEPHKIVHSR